MHFSRIFVIARNVFLEVIRDRILYLIGLFAVLMTLVMVLLPEVAANTENKMILDVGLAGINVLALLVAIFIGTGLINKEIEKKTVLVLISKPISRLEFILGKLFGLSGVMAVLMAALSLVFLGLCFARQVPVPLASISIALGFMWLEMVLLIAIAILFGVFTTSLLATLLTFAVYLVGHLSQDIVRLGKLAESESFMRLASGLYLVLPDLERLNYKNEAIYGMNLLPPLPELALNGLYGVIYTVLVIAIAANIFARRQF
jgi:ABC-type transport system involved in multi-copper enzyme maturation permease subunit